MKVKQNVNDLPASLDQEALVWVLPTFLDTLFSSGLALLKDQALERFEIIVGLARKARFLALSSLLDIVYDFPPDAFQQIVGLT